MDTMGSNNKVTEGRFLDFYDCGSWHYTNKTNEQSETYEYLDTTLMPIGGGVQPEKYYPRKWKSQLSGLFQRFRELPSKAKAFYSKDLIDEAENKECKKMVYDVLAAVHMRHATEPVR